MESKDDCPSILAAVLTVIDAVVVADDVADACAAALEKLAQSLLGMAHDFLPVFIVAHFAFSFYVVLAY